MNAALQCLSNIHPFTTLFLECSPYIKATITQSRLQQQQQQQQQNNNSGISIQQTLAMTYMRLMRDMWQRPVKIAASHNNNHDERVSSVAPVDLIRVIKLAQPMFRGCQQHDSMEFLTFLLDQMHEELKRPLSPLLTATAAASSSQSHHQIGPVHSFSSSSSHSNHSSSNCDQVNF